LHICTGRAEIATQSDLEGGEWSEEKILIARPPTNVGNSTPTTVTTSRQSSISDTVKQQADARMRTPPPPPQPLQSATEEEEGEEIEGAQYSTPSSTIDYSDGFGLFLISDLNDFIVELTYHSACVVVCLSWKRLISKTAPELQKSGSAAPAINNILTEIAIGSEQI